MTIFPTEKTSAGFGIHAAVRAALGRAEAAVAKSLARRKARYEARQVVGRDSLLRDMGVSPGDLRRAIDGPGLGRR